MKTRQDAGSATDAVGALPGMEPTQAGAGGVTPVAGEPVAHSQWHLFLRRFLKHKPAVIALIILVGLYVVVFFFAKQVTSYPLNPHLTSKVLLEARHGPSVKHWFGTDELGRDQFTRIIYAGRVSLTVGLLVAIVSTAIGTIIGGVAGLFGGWVDQLLMRFTDLFLIVPGLAILMMAQKGLAEKKLPVIHTRLSSKTVIILILSFLFWQTIARIVRGVFLSLKEREFVEAARASGASSMRIMLRHMLPNTIGPIAVNTTLVVGYAIILESTLSFLGFGIAPPNVSWGTMLAQSEGSVGTPTAYLIYFPGLALLVTVLCVNFLGDGLRDAFDPQSSR